MTYIIHSKYYIYLYLLLLVNVCVLFTLSRHASELPVNTVSYANDYSATNSDYDDDDDDEMIMMQLLRVTMDGLRATANAPIVLSARSVSIEFRERAKERRRNASITCNRLCGHTAKNFSQKLLLLLLCTSCVQERAVCYS